MKPYGPYPVAVRVSSVIVLGRAGSQSTAVIGRRTTPTEGRYEGQISGAAPSGPPPYAPPPHPHPHPQPRPFLQPLSAEYRTLAIRFRRRLNLGALLAAEAFQRGTTGVGRKGGRAGGGAEVGSVSTYPD